MRAQTRARTVTVVPLTGSSPPRPLGKIMDSYQIDDTCGIELLMLACITADRNAEIAETIAHDGIMLPTNNGLKAHPALRDELNNKTFISKTFERLGINQDSKRPIGRPSASSYRDDDE